MHGKYKQQAQKKKKKKTLKQIHKKRVSSARLKTLRKTATTYSPTCAVPSALLGLTSLFGMGRGGSPMQ